MSFLKLNLTFRFPFWDFQLHSCGIYWEHSLPLFVVNEFTWSLFINLKILERVSWFGRLIDSASLNNVLMFNRAFRSLLFSNHIALCSNHIFHSLLISLQVFFQYFGTLSKALFLVTVSFEVFPWFDSQVLSFNLLTLEFHLSLKILMGNESLMSLVLENLRSSSLRMKLMNEGYWHLKSSIYWSLKENQVLIKLLYLIWKH